MTIHPNTAPLFPDSGPPSSQIEPKPLRVARAHAADGEPAHTAARKHNRSGAAATNLDRVVKLVHALPGRTAGELAAQLDGLEYIEVQRRLSDAKRLNRLMCDGARECRVRGTRMAMWYVNPTAPAGGLLDVRG